MKIMLPCGRFCFLRVQLTVFGNKNVVEGLHSGPAFRDNHYVFLDYDKKDLSLIDSEFGDIVTKMGWRRGIIMESSPGKYWALAFSPTPIEKVLEVHKGSSEDENHKRHVLFKGYSVIRVDSKSNVLDKDGAVFKPRIVKVIENKGGDQFYNWQLEDWFVQHWCREIEVKR